MNSPRDAVPILVGLNSKTNKKYTFMEGKNKCRVLFPLDRKVSSCSDDNSIQIVNND